MEKTGEGMFAEMAKTLEGGADDGGEEAARNVASELAVELVSVVDEEDSNRTRAKFMRVLMLALNIDPEKLEWSPEMDSEVPCRAAHDRQASMMRWAPGAHAQIVAAMLGETAGAAERMTKGGARVLGGEVLATGVAARWTFGAEEDGGTEHVIVVYDASMAAEVEDFMAAAVAACGMAGAADMAEEEEEEEEIASGTARRQGGRPCCFVQRALGKTVLRMRTDAEVRRELEAWAAAYVDVLRKNGYQAEADAEKHHELGGVTPEMQGAVDAALLHFRIMNVEAGEVLLLESTEREVKGEKVCGVWVHPVIDGKEVTLRMDGGPHQKVVAMGMHACTGGLRSTHPAARACHRRLETNRPRFTAEGVRMYERCMTATIDRHDISIMEVCPQMVKHTLKKWGPGWSTFLACPRGHGCDKGGDALESCRRARGDAPRSDGWEANWAGAGGDGGGGKGGGGKGKGGKGDGGKGKGGKGMPPAHEPMYDAGDYGKGKGGKGMPRTHAPMYDAAGHGGGMGGYGGGRGGFSGWDGFSGGSGGGGFGGGGGGFGTAGGDGRGKGGGRGGGGGWSGGGGLLIPEVIEHELQQAWDAKQEAQRGAGERSLRKAPAARAPAMTPPSTRRGQGRCGTCGEIQPCTRQCEGEEASRPPARRLDGMSEEEDEEEGMEEDEKEEGELLAEAAGAAGGEAAAETAPVEGGATAAEQAMAAEATTEPPAAAAAAATAATTGEAEVAAAGVAAAGGAAAAGTVATATADISEAVAADAAEAEAAGAGGAGGLAAAEAAGDGTAGAEGMAVVDGAADAVAAAAGAASGSADPMYSDAALMEGVDDTEESATTGGVGARSPPPVAATRGKAKAVAAAAGKPPNSPLQKNKNKKKTGGRGGR
jgi:hypothetical protein